MKRYCVLLFTLALALFLIGCGGGTSNSGTSGGGGPSTGGGGNNPPPTGQQDLTGNWQLSAVSAKDATMVRTVIGYLTQSGTTISGIVHVTGDNVCFPGDYQGGVADVTLTGTITDGAVKLTLDDGKGLVISMSATAVNGNVLQNGTYTITSGCAKDDSGTLTGFMVPPVTGTWAGTLKANDNSTFNLSGALTQSGPTAKTHGLAVVSSSAMTITNSACFNGTWSITGADGFDVIGGTKLNFHLVPANQSNPQVAITIVAQTNQAATAITGNYTVMDFANGACAGTSGTVSLTKQ